MSGTTVFFDHALILARAAAAAGEVPVGAVVVKDGRVVGEGYNLRETFQNATQHAELIAVEAACRRLGTWRLTGCTLYVTLEPCLMCAGACLQARIDHVVYGAADPKGGALGSLYEVHADDRLNHRITVTAGVRADECGGLLTQFFRQRRGTTFTES